MRLTVTFLDFSIVLVVLFILQYNQGIKKDNPTEIDFSRVAMSPDISALMYDKYSVHLRNSDCPENHRCRDDMLGATGPWDSKYELCEIGSSLLSDYPLVSPEEFFQTRGEIPSLKLEAFGTIWTAAFDHTTKNKPPVFVVRPVPSKFLPEFVSINRQEIKHQESPALPIRYISTITGILNYPSELEFRRSKLGVSARFTEEIARELQNSNDAKVVELVKDYAAKAGLDSSQFLSQYVSLSRNKNQDFRAISKTYGVFLEGKHFVVERMRKQKDEIGGVDTYRYLIFEEDHKFYISVINDADIVNVDANSVGNLIKFPVIVPESFPIPYRDKNVSVEMLNCAGKSRALVELVSR